MAFTLQALEHKLAWVADKVVTEAKAVAGVAQKLADQKPVADAVAALISPKAAEIERAGFTALGLVCKAALDTADAGASNGLNIPMDAAMLADFKAIASFIMAELSKRGVDPTAAPKQ